MSKGRRYPLRVPRYAAGIRAQEPRGSSGRSWWAAEWMRRMEAMGLRGRLGRGRNYAISGQVVSLAAAASVASSEPSAAASVASAVVSAAAAVVVAVLLDDEPHPASMDTARAATIPVARNCFFFITITSYTLCNN